MSPQPKGAVPHDSGARGADTEADGRRASAAPSSSHRLAVDPEATRRFPSACVDRAALEALRATLPPLPPIRRSTPPPNVAGERRDTPHTIVLPATSRKDRATLTVLAGADAGATVTIERAETLLGRGVNVTMQIDSPSVSRIHARIVRAESGPYVLEDLGSTNGTFVDGRRVKRVALRSGDRVQIGRETVYRFSIVDELEDALQRRLYESASYDTLTGLVNRRTLFERLECEALHAGRSRDPLAMLMLDVDLFKRINDTFGHLAGDQVLRAIALAGDKVVRAGDTFARYGGEEFAVVARDASKADAIALAERLREAIAALRVKLGTETILVTVSVGVATLAECGPVDDGLELVARADSRLYAAKLAGRNCVCSDD